MAVDPGDSAAVSLRVSDADRDAAIELLKERTADGTLTLDEFAERVGAALTSQTRGALDAVTVDLPGLAPQDGQRRSPTHTVVSVMSGVGKKGRWRCGSRVTVVAIMGGAFLDFRGAEIDAAEVHVTAVAFWGGIDIVVPEGIDVVLDGLPIMGGKSAQIKNVPRLPGSPRIYVHAYPIMGGISVRSRPRRTTEEIESNGDIDSDTTATAVPVDGTVTLMFSDISDYSGINERLGDVAANELLREYSKVVRGCAEAQSGHVVKSTGDGLMLAFPSALRALRAAVDIQQALAKRNVDTVDEHLHAHIGMHSGEVVRDGDDYLGGAVIIASRLTDAAQQDEILVSSVVRELAAGVREFTFEAPREVTLKGVAETRQAYAVTWQSTTEPPTG